MSPTRPAPVDCPTMATLTSLPHDVLILIFLRMLVEDVLALMQTCRVMHALGSLDYVWRALLSDWDIPLDIPLNASLASLPGDFLRLAAVKSLRLDKKWRNPRLEMNHAQRIMSRNSSFVDSMRILPGGRWLVTVQYEQTSRTHITLWSIANLDDHKSIFKVTVVGRVRFLHAHHHHELDHIIIGITFTHGISESIRIYNVFLQEGSLTRHSLIFEATPRELFPMGQIAAMKINSEIMVVVFAPGPLSSFPEHRGQVVCINLVSKASAVLECPEWSFVWGRLELFRRYFAAVTYRDAPQLTNIRVSFYELPSTMLDHSDCSSRSMPCWPERQALQVSLMSGASWNSENPLVFELSDDVPTRNGDACSFNMLGYPIPTEHTDVRQLGITIVRVSFDGKGVECVFSVVACRPVPSAGEMRVASSGKRAVWLNRDPETYECALIKFALGRGAGNETGTCVSTLLPSFSGLPISPRDFHSFVFDEISCKIAVGLPTGELYILHYT